MRHVIVLVVCVLTMFSCNAWAFEEGKAMKLTSPDFEQNQMLPKKLTCDGEDHNPTLYIENIPPGTKSMVLFVDDPDAPGKSWIHWIVYDIRPGSRIEANSVPGRQGINSFRKTGYGGPCPPPGESHRYIFTIYALDIDSILGEGATMEQVKKEMYGHILDRAELIGLYKRSR